MSGAPATPKPFSFKPGAGSAPSSPLGRSSPSASAPTSRKVSGTTSTKSSRSAAVVEPPEPLLGRSEEGSIHRQVRTLLLDHRKARLAWEQTATYDGLKAVRSWIQADEDVKRLETSLLPKEKGAVGDHDILTAAGIRHSRQHQLAGAARDRESAEEELIEVMQSLKVSLAKLTRIQGALSAAVIETSNSKGIESVFSEPLWGTWTLDRFAKAVNELTSQYVISTEHLQVLVDAHLGKRSAAATAAAELAAAKLSARELTEQAQRGREQLMEGWALLPFLERSGPASEKWFEEVCLVEVGRWETEGR